jgi:hypothetical protein
VERFRLHRARPEVAGIIRSQFVSETQNSAGAQLSLVLTATILPSLAATAWAAGFLSSIETMSPPW